MRSLRLSTVVLTLTAAAAPLFAQPRDAPPVDTANLLKELHRLKDAQAAQSKQTRQTALQQVNAAAGNAERATAMWEEAVRAVQFQGAAKENSAFREWKEKDGEALSGPLARNAVRLYFIWLSITMQRDAGAEVKDLLPQVVNYTRELTADEAAADALEDSIKHEKEQAAGRRPVQQRKASDAEVKRMHDHILRRALGSSPIVQWLKLEDFINVDKWEQQPGDLDGIYNQIVLPELRTMRDPRVLDYWDLKLKKEGEAAAKTKLAFDVEKFNSTRRPALLWSRAQDMLAIGQKNRAVGEMFALIRSNPQNPDLPNWIATLEAVLSPAAAAPAAPSPGAPPGPASGAASPGGTALPGSAQAVVPVVR